jgi:protein gp37
MTLNVDMIEKWARMRKPKRHFICSMTDVFGEWVPDTYIFNILSAMAKAPRQTFQILTKRPGRMCYQVGIWLRQNGLGQLPSNIWLGVSAEDQTTFCHRLPNLIRAKAGIKFLSFEPLLFPINLGNDLSQINWAIIGGESGSNARPLDLGWIEDIIGQCRAANIPAFVKQLGSAWAKSTGVTHSKGGDPDEWPEHLRVRMFPGEVWSER